MKQKGFIQTARLLLVFVFLASLAAPAQQPARAALMSLLYFPSMPIQYYNTNAELSLQNIGVVDASIVVDFYNTSGSLAFSTSPGSIPPGGTLRLSDASLPSTTPGMYQAVVSSSSPVSGVMAVYYLPGRLAGLYPGQTAGQTRLFFGPADKHSAVTVMNTSTAPNQITISVRGMDGISLVTLVNTVPPNSIFMVNLTGRQDVPDSFSGYVVATSAQPSQTITGVENYSEMSFTGPYRVTHMFPPLNPGYQTGYARLQSQVSEYAGPRTSSYFLLNPGSVPGTVAQQLTNAAGAASITKDDPLAPGAAKFIDLASISFQNETTYAFNASGDQPFGFNAVTSFRPTVSDTSAAGYATETTTDTTRDIYLPRLANETNRHSIISIFNTGTSAASVTLTVNMPGAGPVNKQLTLPALGWTRLDLKDVVPGLSTSLGSGKINANQPVTAVVDEFYKYMPPCTAPMATLTHAPQGTVSPTDLVTFTASATGDTPFNYAWTLDGSPTGSDSATYATTFAAGDHSVGVTVSNSCGSDTATNSVTAAVQCVAPTVSLTRSPTGTISVPNTVTFTANTTGSAPLNYAWTLDGTPVGTNSATYSVSLTEGEHTIAVTVTNGCGGFSASTTITVLPACEAPFVTLTHYPGGVLHSNDLVTFIASATGSEPLTYAWTMDGSPAGGNSSIFSSYFSVYDHTVEVTASNRCGSMKASSTFTVVSPCGPPSLTLEQAPAGVIYATDVIQFVAIPKGGGPFSFSWKVDDADVAGANNPNYAVTLPPGNHTVSATVNDMCSASSYTSARAFTVLKPPSAAPDYSLSTLSASVSKAEINGTITYAAVLRNTGKSSANPVTYTNKLPTELTFTPGSASASDGSPVTFDAANNQLAWTGSLDYGIPVVILYSTTVTTPPAGGSIKNTALLHPSSDSDMELSADVPFKVGYGIKINNGALGTNTRAVDLTFTYDAANDGVISYMVSNDAAFDADGSATDWLPLQTDKTADVYSGWQLDPYGDPRMPRTVYIKFLTGTSAELGPFSASILYDVQPPTEPLVNSGFSTGSAAPRLRAANSPSEWQVTSTDDNSGVSAIEISTRPDFSSMTTRVPVTGKVTTFTWQPPEIGPIYIRALDRSNNASPAIRIYNFVYLPLLNH